MSRLVAAALLTILCLPQARAPRPGMDRERLARIRPRMEEFVRAGTIAGAVTLVARHGVVASLEAVGYQDLESRKPMRADTIFQVASMTKPVAAAGIMILLEQGRLVLLDPMEKHLPEFQGAPAGRITVQHLLTHTSGIDGEDPPEVRGDRGKLALTLAEFVALVARRPLQPKPGATYRYSGTGYAVLGRIIEVVSAQPLEKFLEERIFGPLGMKDTFFFPPAETRGRIASVFRLQDGRLKRADVDLHREGARYANAAGGLFSTASDIAAFHQMMLNGGTYRGARVLSKASVEIMTQVHTGDLPVGSSPGVGYGLGWMVVRGPQNGMPLAAAGSFGHSGALGTYGWVDPSKDLIGVFMTQIIGGRGAERHAFMAMAAAAVSESDHE